MAWSSGKVKIKSGKRTKTDYGWVNGAIAVIDHIVDEDDLTFFGIFHLPTGLLIGYLFCSERNVLTIADEIVAMQDWSQVGGPEDIVESSRLAMAEFKTRHLLLPRLPDELDTVLVKTKRQPFDSHRYSRYSAA